MSNEIKGISHIYNEATGQSSVTWSYEDNPELEHFVLEYYDDIKKEWVPYDEHMGIVRKGDTATATPMSSGGGTGGGGSGAPGKDGKSIEYSWRGTELGVRLAGENEYVYVDLKGDKGERGEKGERGPSATLDDLTKGAVLTALGYTPANEQFIEGQLAEKESIDETDRKVDEALRLAKEYSDNQAGADIPPDAVFTDTITSINDKTGVITKEDIMALGIPGQDTLYTLPVAGSILGGVKSGGDITISSEGVVEVKDNSHKHTIADITDLGDFTGGLQKYSTTVGGRKSVIINHNLGSRDLIVSLRETESPYSQVYTTIEFTTINSLIVKFKELPAANEYTITIIG